MHLYRLIFAVPADIGLIFGWCMDGDQLHIEFMFRPGWPTSDVMTAPEHRKYYDKCTYTDFFFKCLHILTSFFMWGWIMTSYRSSWCFISADLLLTVWRLMNIENFRRNKKFHDKCTCTEFFWQCYRWCPNFWYVDGWWPVIGRVHILSGMTYFWQFHGSWT